MSPNSLSSSSSARPCTTAKPPSSPGAGRRSYSGSIWGSDGVVFAAQLVYIPSMTKVLEDVIEKVRRLPEDRQAYVAEGLEQIVANDGDLFVVPEEHRAAVLEGLEQADRGEFASDQEMAALWKKCGL